MLAGLVERVLAAAPQGSDNVILGARRADLAADAKKGRERRRFQEAAPMIVHTILEPRIAFRIGTGLMFQHDRFAVWVNDPVPDEEHAGLAERHLAVVGADQFGALRDEKEAAGRAIIDVLGDLRGRSGPANPIGCRL